MKKNQPMVKKSTNQKTKLDENVDRSEGPGEKWNGRQSDERPQMNVMRQRRWGKRKTKGDRQKEE